MFPPTITLEEERVLWRGVVRTREPRTLRWHVWRRDASVHVVRGRALCGPHRSEQASWWRWGLTRPSGIWLSVKRGWVSHAKTQPSRWIWGPVNICVRKPRSRTWWLRRNPSKYGGSWSPVWGMLMRGSGDLKRDLWKLLKTWTWSAEWVKPKPLTPLLPLLRGIVLLII